MDRHLIAVPSDRLRERVAHCCGSPRHYGSGFVVGTWARASTRTRVSTEAAAYQLGLRYLEIPWDGFYGNPDVHPLSPQNLRAEVLSLAELGARALVARVEEEAILQALAEASPIPVVSGASSRWHPLQALADLRTVMVAWPGEQPLRIGFVGNGRGPVASSLLTTLAGGRVQMIVVTPAGYEPRPDVLALAELGAIEQSTDLQALQGVDAVYVDEWFYRPPTVAEKEVFAPYVLTAAVIERYAPAAKVMHCLPHGDEIERGLLFGPRSLAWEQVRQRTPTLAHVLDFLLSHDDAP